MSPGQPPQQPTDADSDDNVFLPRDRDETTDGPSDDEQHHADHRPIEQGHADVEAGLQDTERIGTPSDVPSSRENG